MFCAAKQADINESVREKRTKKITFFEFGVCFQIKRRFISKLEAKNKGDVGKESVLLDVQRMRSLGTARFDLNKIIKCEPDQTLGKRDDEILKNFRL